MELSLENSWEFFEFTVLKRDKEHTLQETVTVNLYDDDRDMHLSVNGNGNAAIETTIGAIREHLKITPFSFDTQEAGSLYFDIGGNPPQEELRQAMLATISKLQAQGFKLRKLEDTWV